MEREFNFDRDSWKCPNCEASASHYFCGNCGFRIYAGFAYRFIAALIDSLIWLPFFIIIEILDGPEIDKKILAGLLVLCFYIFYEVVSVGFWGQTFGKMYARIKIIRVSGSQISWSNAWLRPLVELIILSFNILFIAFIGYKTSFNQTMESAYSLLPKLEWMFLTLGLLVIGSHVYSWTEVLVLLTNKKRRAIHDFIANTVVIHDPRLTRTPWKSK